jgi:hypothetical protein
MGKNCIDIRMSDDDIWFWYKHIEKYLQLMISAAEYCRKEALDCKKFSNMRYRIIFKRFNHPQFYEKLITLEKEYTAFNGSKVSFCRIHDISVNDITEIRTHLNFQKIIERLKSERENTSMGNMKFIEVKPPVVSNLPQLDEPEELIKKKNDIEIISKGIKVSIPENIDPENIFKLLNFLRDL